MSAVLESPLKIGRHNSIYSAVTKIEKAVVQGSKPFLIVFIILACACLEIESAVGFKAVYLFINLL